MVATTTVSSAAEATPAAGISPLPVGSAVQLLQAFQEVQARRAALYSRFDAGFRRFLQTGQEGIYRQLLADLTHEFSSLSSEVRALEAALRGQAGREELAGMLRSVQERERDKLRLTLSLQALKGAYERKQFSWQHLEEGGKGGSISGDTRVAGVSFLHGGPAHACCGGSASAPSREAGAAPEPSQAEYEAAVAEAIRDLQECVTEINDTLDEVKYAVQEAATAE